MAVNTKTPIMVLQELAQKKHWSPPEYSLVNSISGTHENRFDFTVSVHKIISHGLGSSKQIAKQDAALNALQVLEEMKEYDFRENPTKEFGVPINPVNESELMKNLASHITPLQEMCSENKLPMAMFTQISDIGPPHNREFTYECQVGSIKTEATANTKKHAKQIAAKRMIDRIKNIMPELAAEETDSLAINENDECIKKYSELTRFGDVVPNKSIEIDNYPETLSILMRDKGYCFADFEDDLDNVGEESLQNILSKLELQYKKSVIMQQDPCILNFCVSTDTPLGVMGMGKTEQEAEKNALDQLFMILKCFMQSTKLIGPYEQFD